MAQQLNLGQIKQIPNKIKKSPNIIETLTLGYQTNQKLNRITIKAKGNQN